ncbi:unnamed protein product [Lactuca saligna]|uniref:TIR domain-containing protein n=1 Tax=Lactuca saligna TaxID=75948 RepID=A0AA35V2E0_LACSI|nr:unnamed protein product [Lactuca saligna]
MVVLHEIYQGSPSSSSTHGHRYDVFLSFRGVDTRHSFTNHLYNALMHANITTFIDDEEIDSGEELKPDLESAIKASRASVIVLSKNYAASTWCLDELVLILEQRKTSDHIVIPIFYHVEPTHVRNQQSSFGDAMDKHRHMMEAETNVNKRSQWDEKMLKWNKALRDVADLKGKDVNGRLEVDFIDEVIKDIFRRLRISSRFPLPQLIGVDSSIEFITSWLKDASSNRTDVLTILASLKISVGDVTKNLKEYFMCKNNSMMTSQNEVHFNLDQLDALLGSKGFHPGSKIVITTKDAWLTKSCELFKTNDTLKHATYKLEGLVEIESQKLFCFHAFMCNYPKAGYEEVLKELVKYCKGHPMALKVLGWKNQLMMHQLLQEMGRFVVREESFYKPWERSRLWGHESFGVLTQNNGTENVLGLTLDMRMLEKEMLHGSLELKTDALSKMDRLMLLQLNYVKITGSYKNFPEELRWLCMHGFPLKSIPLGLRMENLVALDMSYSSIESFGIFSSYPQRLNNKLKQLIGSCSKDKRLLKSLKILNLSFCEQLRSLGGFEHLPKLESLILRGCFGLLEVCESIELCDELVLVDLSYCNKLRKLPRIIGMLKKVKTLLLNGCNLGESRIKMRDMDSRKKLKGDSISLNTKMSSSSILKAIPSDQKFFTIHLPISLVELSLENNNLSTESFPMDFSCLSMLEALYLDNNPIVSMPNCVRTLPRIGFLSMNNCNMLTSVEHIPQILEVLILVTYSPEQPSLRKVVFDREMSPLRILSGYIQCALSSFEFEGIIKIQPMTAVEGRILCSLGWTKVHFLNKQIRVCSDTIFRGSEESEIQMYYEFGIFSTIYGGHEMPNWITDRNPGSSISFTIPSSPSKLRGLNFSYVQMALDVNVKHLPMIKISNITKNLTWIYQHYIETVNVGEECFTFSSHWMFGMDEMACGDKINITLWHKRFFNDNKSVTKECGVSIMYDNGDKDEEEEDALDYYKSWNHIIGGDLTGFLTTTGEYILHTCSFTRNGFELTGYIRQLVDYGSKYKDEYMWFRALSQKKSGILGDTRETYLCRI